MPDAGICPLCMRVASVTHMFYDCMLAKTVWTEIDQMGKAQFPGYRDFNYSEIPDLLTEYHAGAIFKVMALWSLWKRWLAAWNDMIELGDLVCMTEIVSHWVDDCMMDFKLELIFRLAEMPAITDWIIVNQQRALTLAQHRRPAWEQDIPVEDQVQIIPEKEFLLTAALQINTNPKQIPHEKDRNPHLIAWLGNQYLWSVTHTRRITFNHTLWLQYSREEPEPDPRDRYRPFGDGPAFMDLHDY